MEEVVLADPEDARKLLVVAGHQLRLGRLFADLHYVVDVLHRAEPFSPQLKTRGNLQLSEAGLQVKLNAVVRPPLPPAKAVCSLIGQRNDTKTKRLVSEMTRGNKTSGALSKSTSEK